MATKILINNVSAQDFTSEPFAAKGGSAVVNVRGTFGPATVSLQSATVNDEFERWLDLTDGTLTGPATLKFDYLPVGSLIRAMLFATDGTTQDIFVEVLQ